MRSHFYLLGMMALRLSPPLFFGLILNNPHVLKGKDDLSNRLSLIQVSGRFSNLRHGKCLVHYYPVLLLSGQSYHFIDVLRRALRHDVRGRRGGVRLLRRLAAE